MQQQAKESMSSRDETSFNDDHRQQQLHWLFTKNFSFIQDTIAADRALLPHEQEAAAGLIVEFLQWYNGPPTDEAFRLWADKAATPLAAELVGSPPDGGEIRRGVTGVLSKLRDVLPGYAFEHAVADCEQAAYLKILEEPDEWLDYARMKGKMTSRLYGAGMAAAKGYKSTRLRHRRRHDDLAGLALFDPTDLEAEPPNESEIAAARIDARA